MMVNEWIDRTAWHPRVHSHAEVMTFYRDTIWPLCDVRISGAEPSGFIAISQDSWVKALYADPPRRGHGTALVRDAQARYSELNLWTHQPNHAAQSFYAGMGFEEVERTDGDNEERVPDIHLRWTCA